MHAQAKVSMQASDQKSHSQVDSAQGQSNVLPTGRHQQPAKYLNFSDLRAKLGNRGRTSIYRDVELGRLPKPIKLGSRLYWNEASVDAAIELCAAQAA